MRDRVVLQYKPYGGPRRRVTIEPASSADEWEYGYWRIEEVYETDCWNDAEVAVYSSSGARYTVNVAVGFCECPSDQYHDGPCKHRERAAYALGHKAIPSWVDRERVDPVLLDRLEDTDDAIATATQEA